MTTPSRTGTPYLLDASGGDASQSNTVPSDCNLIVAFFAHWDGNTASNVSALSVGGQAMSILSQINEGATTDANGVGVAILVNPPTGSQAHALTWSAGGARAEGGECFFVYYKDANTSDPYRAAQTISQTGTNAATVTLANTETTDRVVGFTERYTATTETSTITGVTAFIDNTLLNKNACDVGDATGLSGSVNVGNSESDYSATAAISLKESTGAIACAVGSATASGLQASIQAGDTVACAVGSSTASGLQATISTSGVTLVHVLRGRSMGRGFGRGTR